MHRQIWTMAGEAEHQQLEPDEVGYAIFVSADNHVASFAPDASLHSAELVLNSQRSPLHSASKSAAEYPRPSA